MQRRDNSQLSPYARKLRKTMTPEEKHLWYDFLKELPVTVHRQKVIGSYIVDFYCAKAKLVIELDGSQHSEPYAKEADRVRDEFMAACNIKVLRYSNLDIRYRFDQVCQDIMQQIQDRIG